MQLTYDEQLIEAITGVLKAYIRNVVCIDDEFVGFYNSTSVNEYEKGLYKSFSHDLNSIIAMIKFNDNLEVCLKMIEKANMLILDWELEKAPITVKFDKTLQILKYMENVECPFICIYTHDSDIQYIYNCISTYFLQYSEKEIQYKKQFLNSNSLEINEFEECIEMMENTGNYNGIKDLISQWIKKNINEFKEIKKDGMKHSEDIINILRSIYLFDKYKIKPKGSISTKVCKIFNNNEIIALNLNGKIVVVLNKAKEETESKKAVLPKNVFKAFANTVAIAPNSIFDVIGLYYRTLFCANYNKNSLFLKNIHDNTLFYFNKQLNEAEGKEVNTFQEMILEYFKEDVVSRIDTENYDIDKRIIEYVNENSKEANKPELDEFFKFNSFYAMNRGAKKSDRNIMFGDMFFVQEEIGALETDSSSFSDIGGRIALCITAHCECLHSNESSKNKGNFSFAIGEIQKKSNSLISPENDKYGVYDFIEVDGEGKAVKWDDYFIKLFLKNKFIRIQDDGIQEGYYKDCKLKMRYIGNLREGYTQRIANRLFSFSNRVGITYMKDYELIMKANCEYCAYTFEEKYD